VLPVFGASVLLGALLRDVPVSSPPPPQASRRESGRRKVSGEVKRMRGAWINFRSRRTRE
jgi:hypothetical protein